MGPLETVTVAIFHVSMSAQTHVLFLFLSCGITYMPQHAGGQRHIMTGHFYPWGDNHHSKSSYQLSPKLYSLVVVMRTSKIYSLQNNQICTTVFLTTVTTLDTTSPWLTCFIRLSLFTPFIHFARLQPSPSGTHHGVLWDTVFFDHQGNA